MTVKGSCLCGLVDFEIAGEPILFLACHCTDCQKATGSGFAPLYLLPKSALSESGKTACHTNDHGVSRHFCPTCGSMTKMTAERHEAIVMVPTGTLDTPPSDPPAMRCWTNSMPSWLDMAEASMMVAENPDI